MILRYIGAVLLRLGILRAPWICASGWNCGDDCVDLWPSGPRCPQCGRRVERWS